MPGLKRDLPFTILVLADLGTPAERPLAKLKDRRMVRVAPSNLAHYLESVSPQLTLPEAERPGGDAAEGMKLVFRSFADFEPETMARQLAASGMDRAGRDRVMPRFLGDARYTAPRAAWEGLRYVAAAAGEPTEEWPSQVLALHVSWRELLRDLQRAPRADQSAIYSKVYSECLDAFGGKPIGCIVPAFEFGSSVEDIEILRNLVFVASEASTVLLAGVAPSLYSLLRWEDLNPHFSPERFLEASWAAGWRQVRSDVSAKWLFPVLPRFRPPGSAGAGWVNPAFLAAAAAALRFRESGLLPVTSPIGREGADPCAEWEIDLSAEARAALQHTGTNVLPMAAPALLESFVSASGTVSLGAALMAGRIAHQVHIVVRNRLRTGQASEARESVREWFHANQSEFGEVRLEMHRGPSGLDVEFTLHHEAGPLAGSFRIPIHPSLEPLAVAVEPVAAAVEPAGQQVHLLALTSPTAGTTGRELPATPAERGMPLTADKVDALLGALLGTVHRLRLPGRAGESGCEITFSSLADFAPHRVAEQVPEVRQLREWARRVLDVESLADMDVTRQARAASGWALPDPLLRRYIAETLRVLGDGLEDPRKRRAFLRSSIEQIAECLRRVCGAPGFRELERTWLALDWLARETASDPGIGLAVFPANWNKLFGDFDRIRERYAGGPASDPERLRTVLVDRVLVGNELGALARFLDLLRRDDPLVVVLPDPSSAGRNSELAQALGSHPQGNHVVLVGGELTLRGPRAMSSILPGEESRGCLDDGLKTHAVYPVGVTLARMGSEFWKLIYAGLRAWRMQGDLEKFGLACRACGGAVVVTPAGR